MSAGTLSARRRNWSALNSSGGRAGASDIAAGRGSNVPGPRYRGVPRAIIVPRTSLRRKAERRVSGPRARRRLGVQHAPEACEPPLAHLPDVHPFALEDAPARQRLGALPAEHGDMVGALQELARLEGLDAV